MEFFDEIQENGWSCYKGKGNEESFVNDIVKVVNKEI